VAGYRAEPYGINAEGLRRRNFSDEEIQAIRRAYKAIYRANLRLEEAVEKVREMAVDWPGLSILADFLVAPSRNGIVR
jgi:UDP-N-acetylglucosamine acyltransferase